MVEKIIFNNAVDRIKMPKELRDLLIKYVSGSRTMSFGKCQGSDALMEETNKEAKSWLKMAGIPTEDQWLNVFRNLDELTKVVVKITQLVFFFS